MFLKFQAPKKTDRLTDVVIYSIVKMIELEIPFLGQHNKHAKSK